jgi:hypothetical protein
MLVANPKVKKSKIREEDIIKMGISKTGHKYVD